MFCNIETITVAQFYLGACVSWMDQYIFMFFLSIVLNSDTFIYMSHKLLLWSSKGGPKC